MQASEISAVPVAMLLLIGWAVGCVLLAAPELRDAGYSTHIKIDTRMTFPDLVTFGVGLSQRWQAPQTAVVLQGGEGQTLRNLRTSMAGILSFGLFTCPHQSGSLLVQRRSSSRNLKPARGKPILVKPNAQKIWRLTRRAGRIFLFR